MTNFNYRRLFVYVAATLIVCGLLFGFWCLTNIPDFAYISSCWNDWTVQEPKDVSQWTTLFIGFWVCVIVPLGVAQFVIMFLGVLAFVLLKELWQKAMKWSEPNH